MNKSYKLLAIFNLLLGVGAICLYLPYTLEAFNMPGFQWFKFVPDMLKDNYYDVLIYFGIGLLLWFIVLNAVSLLSRPNLPKVLFKVSTIVALLLPLLYILALNNDTFIKFWIENIAKNVKIISYIALCVSCGTFVLALIYNFKRNNRANLHHILQALFMCALLVLMILYNGWCGWNIELNYKIYGILIGWLAIYLPISCITLFVCRNKR